MHVYYYKCMKYFSAPCSLLNSAIIVPGLLEKRKRMNKFALVVQVHLVYLALHKHFQHKYMYMSAVFCLYSHNSLRNRDSEENRHFNQGHLLAYLQALFIHTQLYM